MHTLGQGGALDQMRGVLGGFDLMNLVVTSLLDGYRWSRAAEESWFEAMSAPPEIVPLPNFRQIEAACFASDSTRDFYITSEQLPAPLARIAFP